MLLGYLVNGSFGLLFGNDLRKQNGLKGQLNLAQGKVEGGTNRNVAVRLSSRRSLGKGCRRKTVRGNSMNKAKIPFGRKCNIIFGK